jgi:hypothetical protein
VPGREKPVNDGPKPAPSPGRSRGSLARAERSLGASAGLGALRKHPGGYVRHPRECGDPETPENKSRGRGILDRPVKPDDDSSLKLVGGIAKAYSASSPGRSAQYAEFIIGRAFARPVGYCALRSAGLATR